MVVWLGNNGVRHCLSSILKNSSRIRNSQSALDFLFSSEAVSFLAQSESCLLYTSDAADES